MPLEIVTGCATAAGARKNNEDYCGVVTPPESVRRTRGVLLAVADGVSGSERGQEAAEACVRALLSDYYATPDTWEVSLSLDRVLGAANRWLLAQSTASTAHATMATTLSALVLRGSRYHIAHVGDTRIYRLRGGVLTLLTRDHVWDHPELQHVLRRAVGLDQQLPVDHGDGDVAPGDRFLLCSDGAWEPLGDSRLHQILQRHAEPQAAADALVAAAVAAGGLDDATALLVRIDALGSDLLREWIDVNEDLPLPPRLRPNERVDGFEVLRLLHESRATLLYQVRATRSGRMLALKTLLPALKDDRQSCAGLLVEEWLAKRVISDCFPQVIPLAAGERRYLYYVMTYHAGSTLQEQLDRGRHFTLAEVVQVGAQLAKGLGVLHRLSILHRDIKPANLLESEGGGIRILDLGVALAAGVPYPDVDQAGTPSFMAPELFEGSAASVRSDLYAAGVTLYYLLTRKYPYGEVEPFQHPRFAEPAVPTRYRPDIPKWVEALLLRAVARDPQQRFETAEELLVALERGEERPLAPPRPVPLWWRSSAARWQAVALIALALNLLLLYLLLFR